MWFEHGFKRVKGNGGAEDKQLCLCCSSKVDPFWQAEQEAPHGLTLRERMSPSGRTYSPSSEHRTPGTLRNTGPGLLSALNDNPVKSQLKPSHKSHLMLP